MARQNVGQQIPVLSLVARSYVFIFTGLRPLIAATWPWMSVVYVAKQAADVSNSMAGNNNLSFGLWISIVANLVASSAVSVLCHRVIILSEWPLGIRSVHFGRRELRYLLALLGFSLVTTLIMILFAVLNYATGLSNAGTSTSMAVAVIIILILYGRASLGFPDLAVADGRLPWHVWRASSGHTARIILGAALSGVPLALVVQQLAMVTVLLQEKGLVSVAMFVEVVSLIITFLAIMSSAAFLSFAYQLLVLGSFKYFSQEKENDD